MSEIRYSRRLGLWQVIARGMGIMVVLFIFVLMDDVVAIAGPLTPLAFLLMGLIMIVNILAYMELSVRIPGAGSGEAQRKARFGGAYIQIHEAQSGWLAFLTGWVLVISVLFICALIAQVFARQVTTLLRDYISVVIPNWPWAVILIVLSAVNNGLGTRGRRQSQVNLLLLAMFLAFALVAFPQVQFAHYEGTRQNWDAILPLLMASFVGVEVVANLQGEISQPRKDTLRGLLLTPSLAFVMGAVIITVALGVVGVKALADSPVPLAQLGSRIVGGAGKPFILVTAVFGLGLAFRWAFTLATRQIFAMSKDGYLPDRLQQLQPRFGTPIWAILSVCVFTLPLVFVPEIYLSRLAGVLYSFVLMSVNYTLLRQPEVESSSFKLPFHPWIPGLVLTLDLFILPLSGLDYLAGGVGFLSLGVVFYLLYARDHHIEAKEGITVFKPPPQERSEGGYRILVPIANPATADTLLRLAGALARQQEGEVLALQVVTVPDQVPLDEGRHRAATNRVLLEQALNQAKEEMFKIHTMTRVAHNVAEGILDTAQEEGVDLIILGWRGYTRSAGASMGPIIDPVIRNAPCDVTVAKGGEWAEAEKILVPTSGGPNAPIAARLASLLSAVFGSRVTALYVQQGRATPQRMEKNRQLIGKTLEGLEFSHAPEQKVVVADSVVEGIVREAQDYDLVLLGASEEGLFDQFAFGSIPQKIAARVPRTAVIVKRYAGPTELWIRKAFTSIFRILPRLNIEEQLDLREALSDSARPGVNYFVLIILSSIIASLGLLLDSAAVVIGAMLVAPLMSPIMGFSLGMVLGDVRMIRLSIEAVFKGVALAVVISVFTGVFSPFKELTNEILSRTQPTLLDLVVALASGMAGAYALARKEVGAALPGVAIAAALMPPLGVVGLGLSLGEPQVVVGALLLFITNIAAISLAGVLVFIVLGVRPQTWRLETRQRMRRGLIGFAILMLVITIPLGVIMGSVVRDTARQQVVQEVLKAEIAAQPWDLVDFEYRTEQNELRVVVTVRAVNDIDRAEAEDIAQALREQLEQPVTVEVVTLPVIRLSE